MNPENADERLEEFFRNNEEEGEEVVSNSMNPSFLRNNLSNLSELVGGSNIAD